MLLETWELFRRDRQPMGWKNPRWHRRRSRGGFQFPCLRFNNSERDPRKNRLNLHSITVRNPLLKEFLGRTFAGDKDINTNIKGLTFCAPFYKFYYRWHRFKRLCQEERNEETLEYLRLFILIINKEILPHIETITTWWGMVSLLLNTSGQSLTPECTSTPTSMAKIGWDESPRFRILMAWIPSRTKHFIAIISLVMALHSVTSNHQSPSRNSQAWKKLQIWKLFRIIYIYMEILIEKLYSRGQQFEKLNGFNAVSYSAFYLERSQVQVEYSGKRHVSLISWYYKTSPLLR